MKSIRLPAEAYRIGHCFSVTIRTSYGRPIFRSDTVVQAALMSLHEVSVTFAARVYGYCFMPDHLHLLARTPEGTDYLEFIREFKQLSAHRIRVEIGPTKLVWQPRFYDHAVRSHEGIMPTLRYIFGNPVRAGLVAAPYDYRHSGSFEWPEILTSGLESPALHSQVVVE